MVKKTDTVTLTDRCDEVMARAICDAIEVDPKIDAVANTAINLAARAALTALLSELDAAGFKIVPKVATPEMIAAVRRLDWKSQTDIDWPDGYADMVTAAPKPFGEDAL